MIMELIIGYSLILYQHKVKRERKMSSYVLLGIPSVPVINSTNSVPGRVFFSLSTTSPGDNNTFQFVINVTESNSVISTHSFPFLNYQPNRLVTVNISLPDGGSFTFTVATSNQYGQAEVTVTTGLITVEPSEIRIIYC